MARSRAPSQSLGAAAPASSARAIASAGLAGRGSVRGLFGARVRGSWAGLPCLLRRHKSGMREQPTFRARQRMLPALRTADRQEKRASPTRAGSAAQSGQFPHRDSVQEIRSGDGRWRHRPAPYADCVADHGQGSRPSARQAPVRDAPPPLAVHQPPTEHSAKRAPEESQQLRAMTIVETGSILLAEQQNTIWQRGFRVQQDQCLGANVPRHGAEQADGRN